MIKGVSAVALILVAFLITSTTIYEAKENSAIAVAISNDNGFDILMDQEAIKEKYGANLEDHFRQTAEIKNIELAEFDLKDVEISNRNIKEGKMNYLTLNASFKDIYLIVAIPVFENVNSGNLYASLEDAGIAVDDFFGCPCETHSCSGQNCEQCKFTEDQAQCINGCDCNRNGHGSGKCNHTVSTLPPGACPPGLSGPF